MMRPFMLIIGLVVEVVTPVNKVEDEKVERKKNSTGLVDFDSTATKGRTATRQTASSGGGSSGQWPRI